MYEKHRRNKKNVESISNTILKCGTGMLQIMRIKKL